MMRDVEVAFSCFTPHKQASLSSSQVQFSAQFSSVQMYSSYLLIYDGISLTPLLRVDFCGDAFPCFLITYYLTWDIKCKTQAHLQGITRGMTKLYPLCNCVMTFRQILNRQSLFHQNFGMCIFVQHCDEVSQLLQKRCGVRSQTNHLKKLEY